MTKERVFQNRKFYDRWDRGSCAKAWLYKLYSENTLFLLKYSTQIRQTEGIVMMSEEGSTKIKNFITPSQ